MATLTMEPIAVGKTKQCGDCAVTRFPTDGDDTFLFEVIGPRSLKFTFAGEFTRTDTVKVLSVVGSSSVCEIHARDHTHLYKQEVYGYWYSTRYGADTWLYRDAEANMFSSEPVGGKTEQKVKDIVSAILTATAPEFNKLVALKEARYEAERAAQVLEAARKAVAAAVLIEAEAREALAEAEAALAAATV